MEETGDDEMTVDEAIAELENVMERDEDYSIHLGREWRSSRKLQNIIALLQQQQQQIETPTEAVLQEKAAKDKAEEVCRAFIERQSAHTSDDFYRCDDRIEQALAEWRGE